MGYALLDQRIPAIRGFTFMKNYQFTLEFTVRDYECDLAGMVNNASYLNYLEHARHQYLKREGVHFAELAQRGIYLVVIRVEADYLYSLRSGDRFIVGTNIERVSRLRLGFQQDIYRLPDEKPVLKAKVIGTAVDVKGKPTLPKELDAILDR
jgi:acyl-CoA thioester hydrolase